MCNWFYFVNSYGGGVSACISDDDKTVLLYTGDTFDKYEKRHAGKYIKRNLYKKEAGTYTRYYFKYNNMVFYRDF